MIIFYSVVKEQLQPGIRRRMTGFQPARHALLKIKFELSPGSGNKPNREPNEDIFLDRILITRSIFCY